MPIPQLEVEHFINPDTLLRHLNDSIFDKQFGVTVLWMPPLAGKSTTLRVMGNRLLKDKVQAAYITYTKQMGEDPLWFKRALHIHDKNYESLEDLWRRQSRTVIFLDGMDSFIEDKGSEWRSFVHTLATHAANSQRMKIIIPLNDLDKAIEALKLNGRRKIRILGDPLSYKWTPQMVSAFIAGVDLAGHSTEIYEVAKKSGVIGEISLLLDKPHMAQSPRVQEDAKRLEELWQTAHTSLEPFLPYGHD